MISKGSMLLSVIISIALDYIQSKPCTKQPLSFGHNCSFICHCLENVCDARTNGIGCLSGKCSPGYTGFPGCQSACIQGNFGVNCLSKCNCEPENKCEPTNGNCLQPNRCHQHYYGPGCQSLRTRLLTAPSVSTDCSRFLISWPKFSSEHYLGPAEIDTFMLLYGKKAENMMNAYPVRIQQNLEDKITVPFDPIEKTTAYRFSVRPDFLVSIPPDRYVELGVPSPTSPLMTANCSAPPDFKVEIERQMIRLSWKKHPVPAVSHIHVILRLLAIGDCFQSAPDSTDIVMSEYQTEVNRLHMSLPAEPWRHYMLEVYGMTRNRIQTDSLLFNITTESREPEAAPANLRLLNTSTSSTIELTWDPPPCEKRHGPFKRYTIRIEPNHSDLVVKPSDEQSQPPLLLAGLQARTRYTVKVAYENTFGVGPEAEFTFNPPEQGSVSGIHLLNQSSTSVLVTWICPSNADSTLEGYQLEYWPDSYQTNVFGRVKSEKLHPGSSQFWISKLNPGAHYKLQIFTLYPSHRIASPLVPFRTAADAESFASQIMLELVKRSSSKVEFRWLIHGKPVPRTSRFLASISLLASLKPGTLYFATRTEFLYPNDLGMMHTFHDLPCASKYEVSVIADPANGIAIEGARFEVWTGPQPFEYSQTLKFGDFQLISESKASLMVRFPKVEGYEGGPLNGFCITVLEKSATGKMVRRNPGELNPESVTCQQSTLPDGAKVAYHSDRWPTTPIVFTSESSSSSSQSTLPEIVLSPNKTYQLYAIVQSTVDTITEKTVAGALLLNTMNPTTGGSYLTTHEIARNNSALIGWTIGGVLILIAVCLMLWLGNCLFEWLPVLKFKSLWPKPASGPAPSNAKSANQFAHYSGVLPKSYAWWSVPLDLREPRYLIVDPEHGPSSTLVGTWSLSELADTFKREYSMIPIGYKYPHHKGDFRPNRSKNRTQRVLPYDHNRVILRRPSHATDTDYINASLVDGYMRRRAYIAAQSPFDTPTATDFWLMVFQKNVAQIVMLTNLVEDGQLKCCQYWPDPPYQTDSKQPPAFGDSTNYFDHLMVQAVDRVVHAHFTVRHFSITDTNTGVVHHVVQYQFHSWLANDPATAGNVHSYEPFHLPDTNTSCFPEDEEETNLDVYNMFATNASAGSASEFDMLAFIEFYYRIKTATRPEDGPILVHCGLGLARTGLFIAFDTLLQQATHERVVSTARVCVTLCKARANMIRSMAQYTLLYDLLYEAMLAGHSIVDLDVLNTYRMLIQKNTKIGRSYLWEQWSVLHLYTPQADPDNDLRVALSASNAKRNRYPKELDLLPPERWRPHLPKHPTQSDYNGYINAVYLDGTSLKADVILTQTPCQETLDDFWMLLDEERVTCIVDMEPFGYGIKGAMRYWPLRPRESSTEPLFEGSSDEDKLDPDSEDTLSVTRSPWSPFCGGRLQLCQVGPLLPVDPLGKKRNANHGVYKRRLFLRRCGEDPFDEQQQSKQRREIVLFHFAGDWNSACQTPESRLSFVHLLESIRLERGTGPLVIHCLDGATRSGLLAACYLLAERMTRDHYVDLFHVIKAVKVRRRAVIGSLDQLRFVYRFLAQWIKQTLAQPLAAWTARHIREGGDLGFQLVGHLPADVRSGIYSRSQLPALVADHPSVHEEKNASNSAGVAARTGLSVGTVYYYFHEELLNQRSTYSLGRRLEPRSGIPFDLNEVGTMSSEALPRV